MKKSRSKSQVAPKTKKRLSGKLYLFIGLVVILAAAAAILLALNSPRKVREFYYGHKVKTAMDKESNKLGDPLKSLGFTDVKTRSSCKYYPKSGYQGNPLTCSVEKQSYKVFADEASKGQAIAAAQKLNVLLNQKGWHQGSTHVAKWFDGMVHKVDYYPDAYNFKYTGDMYCVLDFYEAYSNPKPPAASVVYTCTAPEKHPPIY
jgi:hypothetical protein